MIIDSHCHAGKGDGLTGPWDTPAPLDKYRLRAAQAGITQTVLFAAFHSDYALTGRLRASSPVARIDSLDFPSPMLFMTDDASKD